MDRNRRRAAAIVVGGAVAKGAFAAGALAYLTLRLRRAGTPIRVVVGTSSGALNAAVLAAGVRAGRPVAAAKELVRLWRDRGAASRVLDADLGSALRLGGLSGSRRIVGLLRDACARMGAGAARAPVALRVVVAPLAGTPSLPTSFEAVERFDEGDFGRPAARERIFQAAAASAAFPYAFKPVALEGLGPCVDGGIVNNTPIKEAIEHHPDVEVVYVVVASPARTSIPPARAARLGGVGLLTRLVEMLIDERLVRDLAEARAVNGWLATLDRLVAARELTPAARAEVVEALYGRDAGTFRQLELVEIRPERALEGGSFSGFFRSDLRRAYLRAGWQAAARGFGGAAPSRAAGAPAHRRPGARRARRA